MFCVVIDGTHILRSLEFCKEELFASHVTCAHLVYRSRIPRSSGMYPKQVTRP